MLPEPVVKDGLSKRLLALGASLLLLAFPLLRDTYAGVVQLPQTGQKNCYDQAGTQIPCTGTRQDGELQMGLLPPSPRFTDNNDGTVTDNLTGLIWLRHANCYSAKLWTDALTLARNLASGTCDLSDNSAPGDWRLPNILELESLVDISNINPALPTGHPFRNVQTSGYWSSTTNAFHPVRARYVYMPDGAVNGADKATATHFVWPVRGGR
ncbi:DUF1566 domain-containing protein [Geomonas oryzisoli]|uniref:DUF1566 domain-containing protein n=1 Tax=Geomonas oryzisoli TaxID=2847992 RepID=A0ABX8J8P2_9BACT|nr:DUF1566 domain-containing protein [Geomonas oryzisoli]QWV94730.1 DUF1566 domain-containing protein [Geomonas oryzisoli]